MNGSIFVKRFDTPPWLRQFPLRFNPLLLQCNPLCNLLLLLLLCVGEVRLLLRMLLLSALLFRALLLLLTHLLLLQIVRIMLVSTLPPRQFVLVSVWLLPSLLVHAFEECDEASECATARQQTVAEVACYTKHREDT